MKQLFPLFLLVVTLSAVGCKEETVDPSLDQSPKSKSKTYLADQGGVQITRVYFNEDSSDIPEDETTEYVVLQTDTAIDLTGWKLAIGSNGQSYDIPFNFTTYIEVHLQNKLDNPESFQKTLSLPDYILNNEHDYVVVRDAQGRSVDSLGY